MSGIYCPVEAQMQLKMLIIGVLEEKLKALILVLDYYNVNGTHANNVNLLILRTKFCIVQRGLLPWTFALDHGHYAGWLPVHFLDVSQLEKTYPGVFEEFNNGNFTVTSI